ncbi:uncharacterized protein LOC130231471 [Danio aesculapii]|uniref:uncharacterized protein LOC130231471 n=1 Tax=Danio aesculapii TaxID=1142201 RepID=UPI0024BF397B|nr:uncharacterized protein LOC130231471 [Danio aesculapii]
MERFQLNVIESVPDFGVVSYLADAEGNINVGSTMTPVPTKPSKRSFPTTPSTVTPTLTSTPTNANPQNKTTATENQTSSTDPPTQISENQTTSTPLNPPDQSLGSPIPQNQTLGTVIHSNPQCSSPTEEEEEFVDDGKMTGRLEEAEAAEDEHLTEAVSTHEPETTCPTEPENDPEEPTPDPDTAN